MTTCKRCLNDNTVRRLDLDENGVCAYCRNYDRISDALSDRERLEKLFVQRIEKVRGKHAYDAAIGISGGKDSVFVLHELTRRYGLKVRTFTMLNGFFSDDARRNVDRLVREFGVEHEYIEFDPALLKSFYRYSVKHWLTPCVACSYLGYAAMINYTTRIDAGLCIHGRSPQQMLRYYGDDVFTSFVDAGLKPVDEVDINALYNELLNAVENRMPQQLLNDVKKMLYSGIEKNDFREFVAYFLYHDYDEDEIVRFLRKNTAWQTDERYDHYDCLVHNAAHYIYQCAEGRPHCLPETSVLVRSGKLTRDQAMKQVESKLYHEKPREELKLLCNTLGLIQTPIMIKAGIYKRFVKK